MSVKNVMLLLLVLFTSCEKSQDGSDNILKLYGDALEDIGYSIAEVESGYIMACQFTEVSRTGGNYIDDKKSSKKMGILKTGKDGNVIWQKSFGEKSAAAGLKILNLGDGSVVCTGYIIDSLNLQKDIFIVKVNADGTGPVQRIFKSPGNQQGTDIIKTQEGFMILAETDVERQPLTDSTGNASGKKDILILRINNNLEPVLPPTALGFPGNDAGAAIKADRNGGFIIVGTTDRSEPDQAGNNIFLLRINSDGSATQPRIIGDKDDESASDIEVLDDGYLVAGSVGKEGEKQSVYISKIPVDIYSDPVFIRKYLIQNTSSSVNSLTRYKNNSFVLSGQSGTGSLAQMLIFVIDSEGSPVGKEMIAGGTGIQEGNDVISDQDNNIIVTGKTSYENNSMVSLFKFRFE